VSVPKHHPFEVLRPELQALSAYHVTDSKGYIKLDAMENPYAWPEEMVDRWVKRLRHAVPNRYPDPACDSLKEALRHSNQVPADKALLLGNGSDEIIQILLMALKPGAVVMAPEPTFVMYRQIALSLGLEFVGVPLNPKDFSLDGPGFKMAIEEHQPAMIFLAYPNNPTGNLFAHSEILSILEAAPGLVVLDEAYAPYASSSFMRDLLIYEHLLVMRTLSKLGLAGLRLGFLAGSPTLINEFDKLRLPYNINCLTQMSAEFALSEPLVFERQVAQIRLDRAALDGALRALSAVEVFESEANFILVRLQGRDPTKMFMALKSRGILIKNLHPQGGFLSGCLRITVGTPLENHHFLEAFKAALDDPQ
jgi:histidinol-phosphate aminotransferase